ncbi:MAG: shikimate kinase [Planctomycetes bacterium]|nr:shikimate kinase [Planctomycetota bacterium]
MKGARHLFLIGFRGAGKSAVGRAAARRLRLPFLDLDRAVEHAARMSVREIFARLGEAQFRRLEERALRELCGEPPHVVATGGGIVERAACRGLLREEGIAVWLQVSRAELERRLGRGRRRPSLTGRAPVAEAGALLRRRGPLYRAAARAVLRCGTARPAELARRAAAAYRRLCAADRGSSGRARSRPRRRSRPGFPSPPRGEGPARP